MTAEELEEIEQYVAGGWERDPKPLAISKLKLACEKLLGEARRTRPVVHAAQAYVAYNAREEVLADEATALWDALCVETRKATK